MIPDTRHVQTTAGNGKLPKGEVETIRRRSRTRMTVGKVVSDMRVRDEIRRLEEASQRVGAARKETKKLPEDAPYADVKAAHRALNDALVELADQRGELFRLLGVGS